MANLGRINNALRAAGTMDPVDFPIVVLTFANLRPQDFGARVITASNWIGGVIDTINLQQTLGNPGCLVEHGMITRSW